MKINVQKCGKSLSVRLAVQKAEALRSRPEISAEISLAAGHISAHSKKYEFGAMLEWISDTNLHLMLLDGSDVQGEEKW